MPFSGIPEGWGCVQLVQYANQWVVSVEEGEEVMWKVGESEEGELKSGGESGWKAAEKICVGGEEWIVAQEKEGKWRE
jgi:hypothetical protein